MASNAEVVALAKAVADVAKQFKSADALSYQVLNSNTAAAIDWNQVGTSNAGALDEDGHISGTSYTPAEVSNMIGTLAAIDTLLDGGHRGNLEKLTSPIV